LQELDSLLAPRGYVIEPRAGGGLRAKRVELRRPAVETSMLKAMAVVLAMTACTFFRGPSGRSF
jgi:hypothetical protein